ncbi:MAG: hypothetical protein HUJ26_06255 [Planctomycetaceae bacterium]|nr:hypothetical protein [Planctomycetaceae bacterium]
MPLSKLEIDNLLRLVSLTEDSEITCEQCLALLAEFAQQKLNGKSIDEGLKTVEQHLEVCSECREEYEALQRTLYQIDDDD